ncbi:GAF domain-containing sensor histidine kinase [Myxococcota bacterium]|nr:GAF domain-containing sensor histidine kinase [Myxococcota bacterium]
MIVTQDCVGRLGDPERLAALRRAALLDTPVERAFDRLTSLASRVLRAPIALVSIVDDTRQFFKSHVGLPARLAQLRGTPISHSYCRHAVDAAQPLVIEDARVHPLVKDNPTLHEWGFVAYAGIPLITPAGHALGTLCAIDWVPRKWTSDEVTILRDLAACVMTEIDLRLMRVDEQEVMEALAQERAALALRDELLSIASHELKTPLMPLQLQLDLLERSVAAGTEEPAKLRQRVELATRQVARLSMLVQELLDVSRIRAGRLELVLRDVDLAELVADVADRFRGEAERARCSLTVSTPGPVPGRWDRMRLEQVVTNLLSNAIKYGVGQPIDVTLGATAEEVRLAVRDRGIGIAAADRARIFERFERAAPPGSFGGLGLGLYIARQIADAHGGTIELDSEPGRGSTFTLVLPRRPPAVTR